MATTKEPAPSPSTQGSITAAQNVGGQAPSRTDAIGVKIPVVVHASRYSEAGRDISKTLQPLHEETHTAIVFPHGAVVRLSASLSVGELVVLTNQRSGADVLCRVVSARVHPALQNYVDLEFTQRAPGFWDPYFVAELSTRTEDHSSGPALPIAAAVPAMPAPVQQPASGSPFRAEHELPVPAATPVPDHAPAANPIALGAVQPFGASPVPAVALASSKSDLSASAYVQFAQPNEEVHSSALGSEQVWTKHNSTILTKVVWAATAALIVVGLTTGGFLLGRRGQFASAPAEVSVASPGAPMQPAASTRADQYPISPTVASAATMALSATSLEVPGEPERADGVSGNASQPLPRHAVIHAGRLARPIANTKAKGISSEPPPVLQTQGNNLEENLIATGSLAGTARPDVPAPPAPIAAANPAAHSGGQLQAPKLISSPAPIYPAYARLMKIEGVVVIDALIDGTGKVADAKVVSGPTALQQAAVDALRTWRYQPARLDGQPIAIHVNISFTFR